MARMARLVVSHFPHHVIQRGNRRQKTFSVKRAIATTLSSYLNIQRYQELQYGLTA